MEYKDHLDVVLRRIAKSRKVLAGMSAVLSVVFGVLFLLLTYLLDVAPEKFGDWIWLCLAIVLVAQIGTSVLSICFPDPDPESAVIINSLDNRLDDLSHESAVMQQLLVAVTSAQDVLCAVIAMRRENHPSPTFQEDIEDLVAPFWLDDFTRAILYGYTAGDMYNLAIYLYDGEVLKPVYRNHHPNLKVLGNGRDWRPGQGHVGQVFESGLAHVVSDLASGSQMTPEDYDRYRSAACAPIFIGGDCGGAIVVTSNRPQQFKEHDDDRPADPDFPAELSLQTLSKILGVYFTYSREVNGKQNEQDPNTDPNA